jgi:hypothetical protein
VNPRLEQKLHRDHRQAAWLGAGFMAVIGLIAAGVCAITSQWLAASFCLIFGLTMAVVIYRSEQTWIRKHLPKAAVKESSAEHSRPYQSKAQLESVPGLTDRSSGGYRFRRYSPPLSGAEAHRRGTFSRPYVDRRVP